MTWRPLSDLTRNTTGLPLSEDDIQPAPIIGVLGHIQRRCPHCNAHLHLSDDGVVTCLNACFLSVGEYRKGQEALRRIALDQESDSHEQDES